MNLWVALRYEPWRDVAQSWMIARQLSLPEIFAQLKYEGHPCLWYLLLIPLAKTGVPFWSVIVFSFMLVLAGLCLFIVYAPFGKIAKLVVVFSAAGMYYLPVVARSYSLIPLLLMLVYLAYPKRFSHPLRYACTLFFLCQIHVLLCGLVGVLVLEWVIDTIRTWKRSEAKKAALWGALGIMLAAVLFFCWQLCGSMDTNRAVSIHAVNGAGDLRRCFFRAVTMGSWYLTTIHLYERGNTIWWLVLAPLAVGAGALGVLWLRRAPRSAAAMLGAFIWQLLVHALVYEAHMQHMLTFLWMLLFCVMIAQDELRANPVKSGAVKCTVPLARGLIAVPLVICLLSCAQAYPAMRSECSDVGVNSEAIYAAEYINTELPANAVVLVDSEDFCSPVAAYCAEGKLVNPIRHNNRIISLHDEYSSGWCYFGNLDTEVERLRKEGSGSPLYLLASLDAEAAAEGMSKRSANKLQLLRRFENKNAYEQYLLYRIIEPAYPTSQSN